ncbi:GATA transcription factor 7-like [Coffea arabica]|uniref:GATA transcription factor 7-like n=1 Tax=Coffea arabica TaxID=13443 RepID=A0A6P6TPI8_COFAR|nr:GATA transcription factor 7-like [Coffea arabica]
MLYRTHHHPFLFPLNPSFTSSSLSSSASSSPHPFPLPLPLPPTAPPHSFSPTSSPQVVVAREEGMEGALKSSFRPDVAPLKTNPHSHHLHQHQQPAFSDDMLAVNNNGQNMENDFFVDDLLDFSNAPAEDPEEHKPHEKLDENESATTSITTKSNVTLSPKEEFGSLPDSALDVPADDLESLEWLSHFVEDSFSEYSLTCPVSKFPPAPAKARSEPEAPVETQRSFTTPVQTKARTKRARTGGRVWSLVGSPSLTESSSSSTSSSSTTTSSSSPQPCNPWLAYSSPSQCQTQQTAESLVGKLPVKKQKKKPMGLDSAGGGGGYSGGGQQPRRCSHCGVQKTPQWRAGPLGAKTLCNACGVRYKSGRLLPEYRPACSPTFSSELHSNNHRKVLEMRRKKEVETGLTPPPVQSF